MTGQHDIAYLPLKDITAMHGDEIMRAVERVVRSGWYLLGEEVKAFEKEYAAYTRQEHCIGCANGLDALTLTLTAWKEMGMIAEGDEVIVPANTYIASWLAVSNSGLKPVPVEPRQDTLQIDPQRIEEAVTKRTRCIMIVHLYGYNAYCKDIAEICRRHRLMLLEDCAQAHGLRHETVPADVTAACAYSFYPGKNLGALGDAGCVVTGHDGTAQMVRRLANYGSDKKYIFRNKGRNSRLDDIQAAVLRVKLTHLDKDNGRRQEIAGRYLEGMRNKAVKMPPAGGVVHIFPVFCKDRERLQAHLADAGIATMIHYPIPPHRQEAYREMHHLTLPVTEKIHREELSLPCHPAMTDDECRRVVEAVNAFCL